MAQRQLASADAWYNTCFVVCYALYLPFDKATNATQIIISQLTSNVIPAFIIFDVPFTH